VRYASVDPRLAQFMLLVILIAGLAVVGGRAGEWVMAQLDFRVIPSTEPMLHRMIMAAIAVYVVLMVLPFCPGIEIGLGLIVLFGAPIVPLVYGATVLRCSPCCLPLSSAGSCRLESSSTPSMPCSFAAQGMYFADWSLWMRPGGSRSCGAAHRAVFSAAC
jgi:hypothetical protein